MHWNRFPSCSGCCVDPLRMRIRNGSLLYLNRLRSKQKRKIIRCGNYHELFPIKKKSTPIHEPTVIFFENDGDI